MVQLSPTEMALLRFFTENAEEVLTRERLLIECWGYRTTNSRTVDTTVKQLRKKVEREPRKPRHFLTVYGVGYRYLPLVNEPAPADAFIGRDAELDTALAALEGGVRLLTLVGPGGIGKTRLAREILARSDRYGWFCEAERVRTDDELLAAVGAVIGVAKPDHDLLSRRLGREGAALMVIDNAEQAIDVVREAVRTWLARTGALTVLVTSRIALELRNETTLAVPSLEPVDAVELFRARSGVDADDSTLQRVAEAVDGLPLALELAAARVPLLGVDGLLARLEKPLDVLTARRPDHPERQRSLRASLAWTWDLLSETERRAFVAASCFAGAFAAGDVEAVAGSSALDALQRLLDLNLAHAESGAIRLPTAVRAFGEEQLEDTSRAAFIDGHARWVVETVGLKAEGAVTNERLALARRLEADLWLASRRAVDPTLRAAALVALDRAGSAGGMLSEATVQAMLASDNDEHRVHAALRHTGTLARVDRDQAWAFLNERMSVERDVVSKRPLGLLHMGLAGQAFLLGRKDEYIELAAKADSLLSGCAYIWNWRIYQNIFAQHEGDLAAADATLAEAGRTVGDCLRGRCAVDLRQAYSDMEAARWTAAMEGLERAVRDARRLRHHHYEVSAVGRLADACWNAGLLERAMAHAEEVEALCKDVDDRASLIWAAAIRGGAAAELGLPAVAPTASEDIDPEAKIYARLAGMVIALHRRDDPAFDAAAAGYQPGGTERLRQASSVMVDARQGRTPAEGLNDAWVRAARAYLQGR